MMDAIFESIVAGALVLAVAEFFYHTYRSFKGLHIYYFGDVLPEALLCLTPIASLVSIGTIIAHVIARINVTHFGLNPLASIVAVLLGAVIIQYVYEAMLFGIVRRRWWIL